MSSMNDTIKQKGIGKNMNNNVMKYLSEKKNKAVDTLKEKKDDATRYAEERINAVKEYIEKNGKKIKRSATALALAGLTTLSATTMGGCEEISNIIPGNITHFVEPTIDANPSGVNEEELTGELVLALYDSLVWKYFVSNDPNYPETPMSAQFTKITNLTSCGYGFNPGYWTHHNFNFLRSETPMNNIYIICLEGLVVADGELYNCDKSDTSSQFGCSKESFDAVADVFGTGKYLLTQEMCDYKYHGSSDFVDSEVYHPFDITREDILNATPEQVELLYNLYQSIYSVTVNNIEPELPEGYTPALGE